MTDETEGKTADFFIEVENDLAHYLEEFSGEIHAVAEKIRRSTYLRVEYKLIALRDILVQLSTIGMVMRLGQPEAGLKLIQELRDRGWS